ncbi:protoporphyrinogen/coproporphyrinogen oxidase [Streptomyces iconiensis]|uniref:FAD-dependent oxidoreductase n=1 Tax=Streptomyces iconiensis TaxID=1384038 RepID=A0ABT7A1G9_9ACTN|nr:FAD-dependent oxidoreductase [Streptomyces iconiensis]MDJ1135151.1 FAD-dependent oxidoreductase [Streptomyces iconiensis]
MNPHPPTEQRVIVVGAGIGGLTAAFRLQQAGFTVRVLERSTPDLVGGRMATVERGGFQVNTGAALLLSSYHAMLSLAAEAGVGGQVRPAGDVFGMVKQSDVQRISSGRRLHMVSSPLLRELPVRDLLKSARDFARARKLFDWHDMSRAAPADFESVHQYAVRRGLHPATVEYLLGPFVASPALATPEHASVLSAFFFLNTLIASGGTFTSPRGVGFLPHALAEHLCVEYEAEALSVEEGTDAVRVSWSRRGEGERTETAAACAVAVPAAALTRICPQLSSAQCEYLSRIDYSSSVHVAFGLDRPTAEPSLLLQVPRVEHGDLAAYVLEHNQHPDRVPRGRGLVMAHFRGGWSEQHWDLDDDAVIEQALDATRQLGVLPELERHTTMAEVFRTSPCTVRRRPGEYRDIARFARTLRADSRVQLVGGDVLAHSTTNSSLRSGEEAAARIAHHVRHERNPSS